MVARPAILNRANPFSGVARIASVVLSVLQKEGRIIGWGERGSHCYSFFAICGNGFLEFVFKNGTAGFTYSNEKLLFLFYREGETTVSLQAVE